MPIHGKVFKEGTDDFIRNAHVECNYLHIVMPFDFSPYNITGCYLAYGANGTYTFKAFAPGYQDKYVQISVSEKLAQQDIFLSPL